MGVLGHGLHPPTKSGRIDRPGMSGVRIVTDEPDLRSPDYAELVLATDSPITSRQVHLYRGHWFDALEVYWKDLQRSGPFAKRDYGTSDTAGGMGRNRDSSLVAAHVTRAAGRDAARSASSLSWYAPNFRKYWVTPGLAFPAGFRRGGPVAELVCDGMDRCEPGRQRGPVALG